MSVVTVNGASLHYAEYGSGDEIVISSQWGFRAEGYQELLARSPTNYRVFTLVARGHPPSASVYEDLGPRWYPTWAEDVHQFAQAMGIGRFIYTGASHGAGIGFHLALAHPEVLKAFVSVVGVPHDRSVPRDFRGGARDPAGLIAQLGIVDTTDPGRLARRERMFAGMRDSQVHHRDHGWPFPDATTNAALAARLAQVQVPTLLLAGMQDRISTPGQTLLGARAIPRAKTVIWQDHGHTLATESPDAVIREIKLFIDGLAP